MDKLIKSLAFGIVVCGIAFGFVAGSRIDQSTITLLSGTLVGIAVASPCVAIITWLAIRRKDDAQEREWRMRERTMRQGAPLPPEPPQYWVVQAPPPAQNGRLIAPYGYDQTAMVPRPRRRFYVIGENGEPREVADPTASVDDGLGSGYPPVF